MGKQYLKFWDRIAKRYARQPVADEAAYRTKLEKTREYLTADSEVLEIGCGTGTTALAHAPFVRQITAIDVSEKMLAFAEEKKQQAGIENVRFLQADINDLPDVSGLYHVVMAHSILHLLEDRPQVLACCYQQLKDGGVLVSSTTCMASGGWLKALLSLGSRIGLLPYVAFFSSETLIGEMEAAGFVVEHRWQPSPKSALFLIARKGKAQG